MSGDIAARYLVEDDRCYMHADGSYLGKYQGKLNLILSHEGPKLYHYYFEKGAHILYENDETPYFKRAECKTNSSSSSAAANSGLPSKFVLTHTPEGHVTYPKTNNNTVSIYSNNNLSSSGFNNNANNFNNNAALAMMNPTRPSPSGKELQALLKTKFGTSSATGKRKTRKRKMRTRRYGSRR